MFFLPYQLGFPKEALVLLLQQTDFPMSYANKNSSKFSVFVKEESCRIHNCPQNTETDADANVHLNSKEKGKY